MATEEEKLLLKPAKAGCVLPDGGARRTVAKRIHNLIVARLCDFYASPEEQGVCSNVRTRIRD